MQAVCLPIRRMLTFVHMRCVATAGVARAHLTRTAAAPAWRCAWATPSRRWSTPGESAPGTPAQTSDAQCITPRRWPALCSGALREACCPHVHRLPPAGPFCAGPQCTQHARMQQHAQWVLRSSSWALVPGLVSRILHAINTI